MSLINEKFGSSGVAITVILASLANNGKSVSNEIDNSSDLFFGSWPQFNLKTGPSGVSASGVIRFFAIGSADGGASYPGAPNNEGTFIGLMNANVNATVFTSNLMEFANGFAGKLPEKYKIVVLNETGAALDATEGNHDKFYQGVKGETV